MSTYIGESEGTATDVYIIIGEAVLLLLVLAVGVTLIAIMKMGLLVRSQRHQRSVQDRSKW